MSSTKTCTWCAEEVPAEATRCPKCQGNLTSLGAPPAAVRPKTPAQGLVVSWRKTERQASPPLWEGQVAYVDRAEVQRIEWIPVTYLRPVHSERPDA